MTQPLRYLWRMGAFLALVLLVAALLARPLAAAFAANPVLNGVILAVLLIGIAWNLRQVVLLRGEVEWLGRFRAGTTAPTAPRLLAPMAAMFAVRPGSGRQTISAAGMRSVLDGIASRLDESRELSRYMTGLLIFLGLLGTFWGLLLTIDSIAGVIGGMSLGGSGGDINALFNQLKAGLAEPLRGMGVAFSSSMLGLAGALVLGFLDLTAGQAQNRFFTELEDWLAGLTRLSPGGGLGEGEGAGSVPAYVAALLEQTAENLERLQAILARGEEARGATSAALGQLAERLAVLTDQMRANQTLMQRVADAQGALRPALVALAEGQARPALDEGSRGHLRNTELLLGRLVEEVSSGRMQATSELRQEIKVLTRTLAAMAQGRDAPADAVARGGGG